MNRQGKDKISWTDFTANPIDGKCFHNCWYCYAIAMRKRFELKDKITFKENWFDKKQADRFIKKYGTPLKIFVGSTHDIFGDWIPKEWIEKIIKIVKDNPQCIFQFLTKNPRRYWEFDFPKNCWLGTTITKDTQKEFDRMIDLVKKDVECPGNQMFLSIEPLLGKFDERFSWWFDWADLIIVGAMTGNGKKNVIPKKEWIESIKHPNIHFKNNIKKYL